MRTRRVEGTRKLSELDLRGRRSLSDCAISVFEEPVAAGGDVLAFARGAAPESELLVSAFASTVAYEYAPAASAILTLP